VSAATVPGQRAAVENGGWESAIALRKQGKPPIEVVRAALEDADLIQNDYGARISFLCPLHKETRASGYLKVTDDDTGAYSVTCYGCNVTSDDDNRDWLADFCRWLRGEEPQRTWTSKEQSGHGSGGSGRGRRRGKRPRKDHWTFICKYRFRNAEGRVVGIKKRYQIDKLVLTDDGWVIDDGIEPDKAFAWDKSERFKSGNECPLYNLPAVLEARDNGDEIVGVEGEKDVDNLVKHGHVATTGPNGANTLTEQHIETLRGSRFSYIADDDDRGLSQARTLYAQLKGVAASVQMYRIRGYKDVSEAYEAGVDPMTLLEPLEPEELQESNVVDKRAKTGRIVVTTPASAIKVRRVRWLWQERLAVGTFSLLAGPEGLGKSTLTQALAADTTRGRLEGEYHGVPRPVLVCATEESIESTIVPRLIAAGADLELVHFVTVVDDGAESWLRFPIDTQAILETAVQLSAAMLILDPLTSRVDSGLDTHKDSDVRRALEPLAKLADDASMAILGLIHFNKAATTDPMNKIMASKAFTALARSVSTVIRDPHDESGKRRIFGTAKNNLAPDTRPLLPFHIVTSDAIQTEDGSWTTAGKLEWMEPQDGTIQGLLEMAADVGGHQSAVEEAANWLEDYLEEQGGEALSKDAKAAGAKVGIKEHNLQRAVAKRKSLSYKEIGFPRVTWWYLVDHTPSE
jgi:hypothetical protein